MKIWNSFPMLRFIPPFLIGVVCTALLIEIVQWNEKLLVSTFIGLTVMILLMLVASVFPSNRARFGIIISAVMMALGTALTLSVSNGIFPESLKRSLAAQEERTYLVRVVDEPQMKERSLKVIVELTDDSVAVNGKALLYMDIDSIHVDLKYGDILAVRTCLERVTNLGNPGEFNYERYLRFNGISYRGYVASGRSELLSTNNPGLWGSLYAIRAILIQKLKDARLDGNELSVASALILGHRSALDKELMTAYAGAGATHVLAVSGLHVGIVYVILNSLLKFLDRQRKTRFIKTALLIILLFGYAGLTGLSASVFRAATMFSFVAIGKAIKRDTSIFNTLAVSAFVLISLNPMIIMEVGFQLSYAAVLGIVVIHPWLFNLVVFPNSRLLDWAWSITCVSISAQIATAPLGLLYFHQFPNFFWVSNLLVIPAAAMILYLGFLLFVFSFWQPALLYFGFLLKTLIFMLNQLVVWIEQIPYSVLSGIDISTLETLLIYAIIVSAFLFILQKMSKGLYVALSFAIVFMVFQVVEVYQQKHQEFITIYNVKGETAIALFNGTEVTFISSEELYNDEQSMLFHIRHHWWRRGVSSEKFVELNDSLLNRMLIWGDMKFEIIDATKEKYANMSISKSHQADFLVINDISWNRISRLPELKADKVVIANNYGPKQLTKMKKALGSNENTVLLESSKGAITLK